MKKQIQNKSKKTVSSQKVEVEKSEFLNVEGKFLLVRVGTDIAPASDEQIEEVRKGLEKLFDKNKVNCLTYVTHHAVSIDVI